MDFYITAIIQALCFGPLVFGLFLTMKIFNIPDITADGSYTLGAVVAALCITNGYPVFWAFFAAMVSGALAGCLTGWIHTRLRVHALLSGILVMTALYSINLTLMGRSNIPLLSQATLFDGFKFLNGGDFDALVIVGLIVLFFLILFAYLLRTDFGIAMRATGDTETMVRALGVNTSRMKVLGLAMANALIAVSGCLLAQYQGFADINMGIGIVISGLGAVMIGETLINFLKVTAISLMLVCVLTGVVVFQLMLALALDLGINPNLLKLTTAVLVLLIVALPRAGSLIVLKR